MFVRMLTQFMAAVIAAACLFSPAAAKPVKYEYSVNWSSGELAGNVSNGALSFDSSLALPNAQYFEPDGLSGFSFSMRGKSFGLADVSVGFLSFDQNADLRLLGVGTDCGPGYCASAPGNTNAFYLVYDSQSQLDRFFGVAGDTGWATSYGAGSFQPAPVPEPSTLAFALVGLGFVGTALRRRA